MEWMLQVVDELDDLVGSAQLCWVGARRGVALLLFGIAGAAGLLGLIALGAAPFLICCASVLGSACLALSMQRRCMSLRLR